MAQSAVLILVLLLSCSLVSIGSSKEIALDNNGRYNDVLISLSDDIPAEWSLVDKLKSGFQEASDSLAVASRINGSRSFAFGQVYILVPRSWGNASVDQLATWQSEDVAHFRVGQRGNAIPHTVQPQGCGKPGLHVNLHRDHLRDVSGRDLGKQLVHEFAHLRWGVFDEYNGDAGPHAFLHNGRLQPVLCTKAIRGKFGHMVTGLPCRVDRVTLELEPDCRYIEDEQGQTAQGSLMYATYLSTVRRFCSEPSGNPDLDHNAAAPNPHNRRCGGRSVQSVMLDHQDYRRSIDGRETDTTVNFTVVQRREFRRLVIVMDVSGSMVNQPLAKMKIAVRTLLLGLLEDGINCGMLTFSTSVQRLRNMAPLTNGTVRQDYWTAVSRLLANGGTAIGDALAAAMEMLGANMNSPSKSDTGYIVLLTDGQENSKTRFTFAQAAAIAKRTSIIVDTVAFGNQADKQLADLSASTGGKAYFVRFNSPANDLMEAMSDMVRDRVPTSQKPIDVFSAPVSSATFSMSVQLDASISNAAQFTLSSPATSEITGADLQVVSPSGVVYSKLNGSTVYLRDDSAGIVSISTGGKIEPGVWTVRGVANSLRRRRSPEAAASQLSVVVTSRPTDAAPIILDGSVSDAKVALTADTQVSVFATMAQGANLVLDANITAFIESDIRVEAELTLRDDGVGADAVKSDGVYSGYVPTTVNVKQEYNVRLVSHSPVSRVSTAGKFEVTSVDLAGLQKTPPAAIGDLRAKIRLSGNPTVTISFTAVGAKRMEGNASSYILWLCSSPDQLEGGPSAACSNRTLPLEPPMAGTPIELTVPHDALAGINSTAYLAVVADNGFARGALSNVVSVQTRVPENIDDVERASERGGGGGLAVIAIVFIAVGAVLLVGLLVGLGVFFIVRRQNGRPV